MTIARCIAVDWGSSSLRATLLGDGGEVLERISRPKGILAVPDGGFPSELDASCGKWRTAHPGIPVLMSGMIGSRQGWVEAPYLETPCRLSELINRMVRVPDSAGAVRIMPGVQGISADGMPEIIRGEETQVGGVIERHDVKDGLFCIPGTHSKWIHVADRQIRSFSTFMTGECFAILKKHSILGRLMVEDSQETDAFRKGLEQRLAPGGLLHHLFAVRTMGILGKLPNSSLAPFLSGQLIGSEIAGARALFGEIPDVHLVASGAVGERYNEALNACAIGVTHWDAEAAADAGLWIAANTMMRKP